MPAAADADVKVGDGVTKGTLASPAVVTEMFRTREGPDFLAWHSLHKSEN